MKPTLSLNMIARNEAPRIARALESAAKVCDELTVIDTGSTDGTQEIARACGATVIPFAWCDDFSAARNFALDCGTADWALVLDADDEIDDENAARINALVPTLTDRFDAVIANYRYEWRDGVCVTEMMIQRLIRRTSGRRWIRRAHELFNLEGSSVLSAPRLAITHRGVGKVKTEKGLAFRLLEKSYDEGDRSARTLWYLGLENMTVDRDRARQMFVEALASPQINDYERYHALSHLFRLARFDNDLAACIALSGRMLDTDPNRAEAYIFRGLMAIDGGSYRGAIHLLETAIALPTPTDGIVGHDMTGWFAHDYLARAYAHAGDAESARDAADIARRTHPDPDDMDRALAAIATGESIAA